MDNRVGFSVYGLVYKDFTSLFINGQHILWFFIHTLATDVEFQGVIQVLTVVQLEPKEYKEKLGQIKIKPVHLKLCRKSEQQEWFHWISYTVQYAWQPGI